MYLYYLCTTIPIDSKSTLRRTLAPAEKGDAAAPRDLEESVGEFVRWYDHQATDGNAEIEVKLTNMFKNHIASSSRAVLGMQLGLRKR
ncbi:hypothetical protein SARC_16288, partial [Sphaeroforma arctica JP610]